MLAQTAKVTMTLLNPGFEYLIFDDNAVDAFVAERFPHYGNVFASFPYRIQKIDFFRYLAVWELGGFYFDLDVFLVSSLDPLLQRNCVFPFEELTFTFGQKLPETKPKYDYKFELDNWAVVRLTSALYQLYRKHGRELFSAQTRSEGGAYPMRYVTTERRRVSRK